MMARESFIIREGNAYIYFWSFERKTYTWSSRKSSYFWNPADFTWNLADFTWNPVDFMKSGRFHMKSGGFHVKSTQNLIKLDVSTKTLQFRGCREGGYDPGFHEILVHSPSPAFIKLNSFGWNICFYKVLGGFHMKSAGFHVKSTRFHARFHEIERPLARNCNPMLVNYFRDKTILQPIILECLVELQS